LGHQWIALRIDPIAEGAPPTLHRLKGNRGVSRAQALAAKAVRLVAVGLGADEFTVGRAAPEVRATSPKELPRETAEQLDELAGIGALEGGMREIEQQFLKRLVRAGGRFRGRSRISCGAAQCAPIRPLSG